MIEDFHGDLTGCFHSMDEILEAGDYLVIEDSFTKQQQLAATIAGKPYFIDTKYTDFFGINCTTATNSIFVKRPDAGETETSARQGRQLLRDQDRAWRQRDRAK